jgi:hypothetical protein
MPVEKLCRDEEPAASPAVPAAPPTPEGAPGVTPTPEAPVPVVRLQPPAEGAAFDAADLELMPRPPEEKPYPAEKPFPPEEKVARPPPEKLRPPLATAGAATAVSKKRSGHKKAAVLKIRPVRFTINTTH